MLEGAKVGLRQESSGNDEAMAAAVFSQDFLVQQKTKTGFWSHSLRITPETLDVREFSKTQSFWALRKGRTETRRWVDLNSSPKTVLSTISGGTLNHSAISW